MVQGGMTCIKYLMFVFNFVFVVCGIALIAFGIVVRNKEFTVFLNSQFLTAPALVIIVGVIIFILAFLGCFGSIKENHCMVTTFGILLFIVFVIELAGGITAYVYRNEVQNILKDGMNITIQQNKQEARKMWDDMQKEWKCCGVDGPSDYPNSTNLPITCCDQPIDACNSNSGPKLHNKGCYEQLLDQIDNVVKALGGVAIGIGIVELLGVMMACCLASAIKKEYEGV